MSKFWHVPDAVGELDIAPYPGPQTEFLQCPADILVTGGAAGGGKSYSLLFDCLKYSPLPGWHGIIFRRLTTELTTGGGIWDTARSFFGKVYGSALKCVSSPHHVVKFPNGGTLEFRHLQRDDTVESFKSSQYDWIGFEEATQFTEHQFFYMASRNRSPMGYPCRIRLTTNPDADSWLKDFLSWWIDQETGYAIPARSGTARHFYRNQDDDTLNWYSTRAAAEKGNADLFRLGIAPKSVVFIPSSIEDNPTLYAPGSQYFANLMSLPLVERERLAKGNWLITASDGLFKREWFQVVGAIPAAGGIRYVRAWDLAATAERDGKDPCYTVGVLMAVDANGVFYVVDVARFRSEPLGVINAMVGIASQDRQKYGSVQIAFEEEGGSGGKFAAGQIIRALAGFNIESVRPDNNKEARAKPFISQAQANNVKLVNGPWIGDYLNELVRFPFGKFADQVDATSLAFSRIAGKKNVTAGTSAEVIKQMLGKR
jgi:predicted phage terminase large subunit-like protein